MGAAAARAAARGAAAVGGTTALLQTAKEVKERQRAQSTSTLKHDHNLSARCEFLGVPQYYSSNTLALPQY